MQYVSTFEMWFMPQIWQIFSEVFMNVWATDSIDSSRLSAWLRLTCSFRIEVLLYGTDAFFDPETHKTDCCLPAFNFCPSIPAKDRLWDLQFLAPFLVPKVSLNRSNSLCTDGCYDSLVQMHLPQIYSHQPTCWMWIILQLSSYLLVH